MAKVTSVKTGDSVEVKDGDEIREACESLGVLFACADGICGTCMIDIHSGKDNLTPVNDKEKDLDRDPEHRLACQCKIKKGEIKIDF